MLKNDHDPIVKTITFLYSKKQVGGAERKGKERKGKERKGKERKGKERKGKERISDAMGP